MPNYVRIKMNVSGKATDVANFKSGISNTEGKSVFDFNRIIPMPEELNIESSSAGEWGRDYINAVAKSPEERTENEEKVTKRFLKMSKEEQKNCIELGQKYIDNIAKYGCATWYGWCPTKWGTKWNACDAKIVKENSKNICYVFKTAWAFPHPVIKALAEKYPTVKIEIVYADEDCGYNTGSGYFKGAHECMEYPNGDTDADYENYNAAWDTKLEKMKIVNGSIMVKMNNM